MQVRRRGTDLCRLPPGRWRAYFAAWALDRQVAAIRARRAQGRRLDALGSAVAAYELLPCDLDVVLFKATENSGRDYLERDYGWHRVTTGSIEPVVIGGAHFSFQPTSTKFAPRRGIMEPPHVHLLASAIAERLRGATEPPSPPANSTSLPGRAP